MMTKRLAITLLMICAAAFGQTKGPAKAKSAKATTTKAKSKSAAVSLLKPATLTAKPPAIFVVRLETTKGNVDIRVVQAWAPNGAGRFYNLVRAGFYNNTYFFRVLDFMAQIGISSDPAVSRVWADYTMLDDRVIESNRRGMVTFAATGAPNSRSTQFFINKKNENSYLDASRFAPFGEVVAGMEFVDQLYSGYGEPPIQGELETQGGPFIERNFPRMDKIVRASVIAVPK